MPSGVGAVARTLRKECCGASGCGYHLCRLHCAQGRSRPDLMRAYTTFLGSLRFRCAHAESQLWSLPVAKSCALTSAFALLLRVLLHASPFSCIPLASNHRSNTPTVRNTSLFATSRCVLRAPGRWAR
jgi:hypothetical protein